MVQDSKHGLYVLCEITFHGAWILVLGISLVSIISFLSSQNILLAHFLHQENQKKTLFWLNFDLASLLVK